MSAVLKFLETLGQASSAIHMSDAEYASAVARLEIAPAQRDALLARDAAGLNGLLGARATMFFGLVPAENEEPQRDDGEETPDQAPDNDTK